MNSLWRIYFLLVLASVLFTCAMVVIDWIDIKEASKKELVYANSIISHPMASLLDKNEALLDVLGSRLVEINFTKNHAQALTLISEQLDKNQDLVGFGLALPSGRLILTTSNLNPDKLPNLLHKKETSTSFKKAMKSNDMVVGRTYYLTALQQWIIPIRKRIVDHNNNVIAIMTSGLKLNSVNSPWSSNAVADHMRIRIMKNDFYLQYISHIDQHEYKTVYSYPLPEEKINRFRKHMQEQTGFKSSVNHTSQKAIVVNSLDYDESEILTSLSYNKKYGLYTFILTPIAELYNKIYARSIWYLTLLILFNISLYFLFRFNVSIQNKSKNDLEFQATHDQLTNLPNRRYLLNEFENWKQKYHAGFSVFFIDLDNFKNINDLHGHSLGDRVLCEVASRITNNFKNCLAIRQGGDEFIILTPSTTATENIRLCRNFLTQLHMPIDIHDMEFSARASIGIVLYPENGDELDILLSKADMAMYEAKRLKCDFFTYSDALQEKTEYISNIEHELLHALTREEFFIMYQPQIEADGKTVVGVEALLRWNNPRLGFVPPDQFIAIAESTGLIHEIGLFVFETALIEFIDVTRAIPQTENKLRLSINISVQQMLGEHFVESILQIINRHDCSAIEIAVEVTESLFIENVDKAKAILQELQEKNIFVSLDDFGTGYSSLGVLGGLPINELKIDRTFVQDILSKHQDLQLIKSIISLGKSLNIPVLAEGVEQLEQVNVLSEHGCDLFQGYYFSKPLTKSDLITFFANYKALDKF
jgi:diguanylate cyclase (GGDEF)-like protein